MQVLGFAMGASARSCTVAGFLFAVFCSPVLVEESLAQEGRGAFAFGFGAGSATIMCSACSYVGNIGGYTATIQVRGLMLNQHLGVGVSGDWWWHQTISRQGWDRIILTVGVPLFYYPWANHGFFVEGGPAISAASAAVTDSTGLRRHGWGFTIGAGYDIAPGWTVSLTPRLAYSYAWVGNIYYPLGSHIPFARGWKHGVVSLGLGLTLHERRANRE